MVLTTDSTLVLGTKTSCPASRELIWNGEEAVLRPLADRKHTAKAGVDLGLAKRDGVLERSMVQAAILVSEGS